MEDEKEVCVVLLASSVGAAASSSTICAPTTARTLPPSGNAGRSERFTNTNPLLVKDEDERSTIVSLELRTVVPNCARRSASAAVISVRI